MNKKLIIFILAIFFALEVNADWFCVNSYNRVPAFSKIAELGKVSIFVVSTNWCTPCKILKEALKDQNYDMSKVDIYIVNMAPEGYSYENLKNTEAYYMWRGIENLDRWPTIYITSQTTNLKAIINDKGDEKDLITRINKIISSLIEKNKYFHRELVSIDKSDINNVNLQEFHEKTKTSINRTIDKITSDFNDSIKGKDSIIQTIKDTLVSQEILNFKVISELKDSISVLNTILVNSFIEKAGVTEKLALLKGLVISSEGIQFFETNNKVRKRTNNHYKTSEVENIIYTKFSSLYDTENFIFKIRNLESRDYLILDSNNPEKEIYLRNGTNNVLTNVDLSKNKSNCFQFEIYKFGVLVLKSEYIFKK